LRAELSNPHPVAHCDGDCRVAALLAMTDRQVANILTVVVPAP
jgi:hypothetical protein